MLLGFIAEDDHGWFSEGALGIFFLPYTSLQGNHRLDVTPVSQMEKLRQEKASA